jgi:putative transposase
VVLERPKVRGTTEPFVSRVLGKGVSRTNALEALVISGFVRGLSVRHVEAALAEALGPEAAAVEVDHQPGLPGDQGRVRRLEDP